MSTKSKSYVEQINNAQVMLAGLSNNLAKLEIRGMTQEFISNLRSLNSRIIEKNNEQEKHKADLKLSTAALEGLLKELDLTVGEATKVVKLEMPKEQWQEFGITAKR